MDMSAKLASLTSGIKKARSYVERLSRAPSNGHAVRSCSIANIRQEVYTTKFLRIKIYFLLITMPDTDTTSSPLLPLEAERFRLIKPSPPRRIAS